MLQPTGFFCNFEWYILMNVNKGGSNLGFSFVKQPIATG